MDLGSPTGPSLQTLTGPSPRPLQTPRLPYSFPKDVLYLNLDRGPRGTRDLCVMTLLPGTLSKEVVIRRRDSEEERGSKGRGRPLVSPYGTTRVSPETSGGMDRLHNNSGRLCVVSDIEPTLRVIVEPSGRTFFIF